MASTTEIKILARLGALEARVLALEGGYVKVPEPETDETKPDLPDKETEDVEQNNGADPENPTVEDVNKDDS